MKVLDNLNKIDINTFNYLGVNKTRLEYDDLKYIKKNKESKLNLSLDYITITRENDDFVCIDIEDKVSKNNKLKDSYNDIEYLVSKELYNEALNENNIYLDININKNKKENVTEEKKEKKEKNKRCILKIMFNIDKITNISKIIDYINIYVGNNIECDILILYNSHKEYELYKNSVLNIYAGKDCDINIFKINDLNKKTLNFDSNIVVQDKNSMCNTYLVYLGSSKTIANYSCNLNENDSNSNLECVYAGTNNTEIDISLKTTFKGKNTNANMSVKGILNKKCKKVLKSTLDFKKGCKKSKGEEKEEVLLLSKDITNKSVPLLLCSEDDVEGAHSVSCGKLPEEKLFYLNSRGFTKEEAIKLLINGFINSSINNIPDKKIYKRILNNIEKI